MASQRIRPEKPKAPPTAPSASRRVSRPAGGTTAAVDRGRFGAESTPHLSAATSMVRATRLGHNLAGSEAIQRAVIPVYKRNPRNDGARVEDQIQVDKFAIDSSQGPHAGAVRAELTAGGDLRGIDDAEKVILAGHGNVGRIQGYAGSEVATYLKTSWHLPKSYAGDLQISSCKAGDAGFLSFLNPSLVQSVSDNLLGYSATVVGLKGNVVTGSAESSAPGVDRSVGDDRALARFRDLERTYRETVAARDSAFESRAGLDVLGKRVAKVNIQRLQLEKSRLEREQSRESVLASAFSSVSAFLSGGGGRVAEIDREILQEQAKIARYDAVISGATAEVASEFQGPIAALRHELDSVGRPLGTADVTVRHTPADRETLGNQFVEFLLTESAQTT
ncbi:MAG TPA: hypothetical protein VIH93_00240 [Thermoanaerobaculia bacterium]